MAVMEAPSSTLLEPARPERSKEHWMVLAIALTGLVAFALVSLLLEPDPLLFKRYERNPYGNYYLTGKLRFPVEPQPAPISLAQRTKVDSPNSYPP